MKKILVAVDGSDESKRAARQGADIAVRFGAKLTLLHVIAPLLVPPDAYGLDLGSIAANQESDAEKLLREAEAFLEEPGIEIQRQVAHGPPAEMIHRVAVAGGADLVVVGSRGRNAAARVLLGSVSDRLVHISSQPILVVR
jgi:nucleotide-binding universal stress UspA family protein